MHTVKKMFKEEIMVLIKGVGEIASGVAYRLFLSGLLVCMTEIPTNLEMKYNTFLFSTAEANEAKTVRWFEASSISTPGHEIIIYVATTTYSLIITALIIPTGGPFYTITGHIVATIRAAALWIFVYRG